MTTKPIGELKTWADFEALYTQLLIEQPKIEEDFGAWSLLLEFSLLMQDRPIGDATATEVKAWRRDAKECVHSIVECGDNMVAALHSGEHEDADHTLALAFLKAFATLKRSGILEDDTLSDFTQKAPADILRDLLNEALHPSRPIDL